MFGPRDLWPLIAAAARELGRTVRYALGSNSRTARLGVIMILAAIVWWLTTHL
jgi:hypothetical protein